MIRGTARKRVEKNRFEFGTNYRLAKCEITRVPCRPPNSTSFSLLTLAPLYPMHPVFTFQSKNIEVTLYFLSRYNVFKYVIQIFHWSEIFLEFEVKPTMRQRICPPAIFFFFLEKRKYVETFENTLLHRKAYGVYKNRVIYGIKDLCIWSFEGKSGSTLRCNCIRRTGHACDSQECVCTFLRTHVYVCMYLQFVYILMHFLRYTHLI